MPRALAGAPSRWRRLGGGYEILRLGVWRFYDAEHDPAGAGPVLPGEARQVGVAGCVGGGELLGDRTPAAGELLRLDPETDVHGVPVEIDEPYHGHLFRGGGLD